MLPFIGKKLQQLRTRLVNSVGSNSKLCKLNVIFQAPCKLNFLFHYKDTLEKKIHSDIAYRYTYSNCKVTYYHKTYRQFFTRASERKGVSNLTRKRLKKFKQSVVFNHLIQCN